MSQQHLQGFLADVRTINPRININDKIGKRTSLAGLITYLQTTVNAPVAMTALEARQHCANQFDQGLTKYSPAVERLVSVWGRGNHRQYPQAAGFVPVVNHLYTLARRNFDLRISSVPENLRPDYANLEQHDDNPWMFGNSLGPGYLHRVIRDDEAPLDITARGLILKAGLSPPSPANTDNGYIACLQLTLDDLTRMGHKSILDVGCGAAIFRAEMEALYSAKTTGIDPNYEHIADAVQNGQRRYVRSTFYLKMMLDKGYLARTSVPLWASGILDRQVLEMQNILQAYEHNPPIDGDVFKLGEKPNWDFTVCMFLLCYFDAEQQTNAVLSMCEATKEAVYLYSGQGAVLTPRLVYDQAQVRARFPGVNIVILDDRTHHIMLPAGQIRPAPESSSSKA